MATLSQIARALGGDVVGQQILCPGPQHGRKDRSLSVRFSPQAPDGFVVFSHAGDDMGACKDHVRALLGWDRPARDRGWRDVPAPAPKPQTSPDLDEIAKIARAAELWIAAVDPRGSIVEVYLASRGLALPEPVAGETIRFHPACPWKDEETGRTIRVPAMVAAMRSIATEEITAVHRTRLTADGRKVDRRMLGKASGAAIMLCPFHAIGSGLTVGEGIETTLAAWQLGWANAWAVGSVGAIASLPVLAGVQSLTLLAETGDGGASARAIQAVAARYEEADREVLVVEPRCEGDINDALRGRSAA